MKVAHIVNPIKDIDKPDLQYIQAITFVSMDNALRFYEKDNQAIDYEIVTTQYPEDHISIPTHYRKLSDLERSVLDVDHQLKGKKLPLIHDIFQKALEETESDYIIYTNIDIALKPGFYDYVNQKINDGFDAIVINRRRINWVSGNAADADKDVINYYGQIGRSHPGFDCFVLKRELVEQMILKEICIGISFLETSIIHNIAAFAKNPTYIFDQDLTFHLGTEVLVPRKANPFYWHNRNLFFKVIQPALKPHWTIENFPYGKENYFKRSISWALNPSLFSRNFLELQGKSWRQKLKMRLDEIRWRILQK